MLAAAAVFTFIALRIITPNGELEKIDELIAGSVVYEDILYSDYSYLDYASDSETGVNLGAIDASVGGDIDYYLSLDFEESLDYDPLDQLTDEEMESLIAGLESGKFL